MVAVSGIAVGATDSNKRLPSDLETVIAISNSKQSTRPHQALVVEQPGNAKPNDSLELTDQSVSSAIHTDQSILLADTSVSELIRDTEEDAISQVTSVSQLSDVQPTDWAFQSIQSLVERYGCVAGYPDGSFKPNRAMSRREAAALVNACLDNLSNRFATKEDLDAVKALQDEFAAELATLRGRVDGLEARVATVEAQQFSTTTKLQGQVVMAAQFGDFLDNPGDNIPTPGGVGTGTPIIANSPIGDSRASAIARVRLSFLTSFNGDDVLDLTLETGNGGSDFFSDTGIANPTNNPFPVPPLVGANAGLDRTTLGDPGIVDYTGSGPEVSLYNLGYTFKPAKNLAVTIGPLIYPSAFIDSNSYANDEAADFSSGFFINNPLIIAEAVDGPGGAGAAFDWNVNGGPVSVRGLFIAADAASATGVDGGLVGDPFQASAEIEYSNDFGEDDQNSFAIRAQFTHAETYNVDQNIIGANAELTIGQFGLFGRYGLSIDPRLSNGGVTIDLFENVAGSGTNTNIQTWMAGVGVKDLLVPGSLLAVAAGQPFIVSSSDPNYATQTNFEAFYRFPVNENITITPTIMLITNPFNISNGNPSDIIQGLVRATFSF
ncbi:MAG: iron uptake porin [Acaryochloris sp. RU_4_1]|nr:iron uptake porin [Acaryochloris sp. SU_5_25]NJM68606.1 iron uptake porin [Acaryochloris sp. RU_4_1]NJR54315.1 iron uptake porin [Acaryochloris sp. CRU_2_0]